MLTDCRKSFADGLSDKFSQLIRLNIPSRHKYVATLPCEIRMSEKWRRSKYTGSCAWPQVENHKNHSPVYAESTLFSLYFHERSAPWTGVFVSRISCTECTEMRPIVTPPPIGERSIVMSVSVCLCLCVCPSVIISPKLHVRFSPNFLRVLPMAMARSSSGSVVICYVLPVLWMTSYLLIGQGSLTSPPKLKRSALAALGLAINCAQ